MEDDVALPNSWHALLGNRQQKRLLLNYISMELLHSSTSAHLRHDQKLVVAGGFAMMGKGETKLPISREARHQRGNRCTRKSVSAKSVLAETHFLRISVSAETHLLGNLSLRRKYLLGNLCQCMCNCLIWMTGSAMEDQMYERVVFYLENGSYPTGRLTNSCHVAVRLPMLV